MRIAWGFMFLLLGSCTTVPQVRDANTPFLGRETLNSQHYVRKVDLDEKFNQFAISLREEMNRKLEKFKSELREEVEQ